ncbi:MAG TPA: DUF5050 domain-containing protein [Clostridia bacterium]|nr:DUF5050 domain-containing protein [Clostridia bacterium]
MRRRHIILAVFAAILTLFTVMNGAAINLQADQGDINKVGNTQDNQTNSGYYAKQGEWIYFSNDMDGRRLYKMKTDGSSYMKLNNDLSMDINVIGDWIYYTDIDEDSTMYKIKTDGTGKTRICNDKYVASTYVVGNWIYYTSGAPRPLLYRIGVDGKNKKLLAGKDVTQFVVVGDYIYYDERGKLSKVKTDGTGKKLISQGGIFAYFTVYGDWIYFSSPMEDMKLYKMKTNGTQKTKVYDIHTYYKNISGDWIYFSNFYDGSLNKVKLDGTGMIKLSDDGAASNIHIIDDLIFFREDDVFNRAKTDGTEKQKMKDFLIKTPGDITSELIKDAVNTMGNSNMNLRNDAFIARQGDWEFYQDGSLIYRQKTDGSRKEIIKYVYRINNINVVGNMIYYMAEEKMYRSLNNGSAETKLSEDPARYMYVVGDWIYYVHNTENKLYRMKTDGSGRTLLCTEAVEDINIIADWIYFNNDESSKRGLYKMKLDGTEKSKLSNNFFRKMIIADNSIYYLSDNSNDFNCVYKASLDGKTARKKISTISSWNFTIAGDWVYYTDYDNYNILYKAKTDGSGETKVGDFKAIRTNIIGDWVYFEGFGGMRYGVYKIKPNGTESQILK